jgi:predicted ATPase
VYVDHGRMGLAPLTVFGDGLRRAVLLAATVLTFENGGVLFLDEIESGIHVRALERVFTWLGKIAAERNVQIFATTHSLEAVDAIAFGPASTSGVVVYNLDQRPERTAAKRLDAGLLERLRQERGLDVR